MQSVSMGKKIGVVAILLTIALALCGSHGWFVPILVYGGFYVLRTIMVAASRGQLSRLPEIIKRSFEEALGRLFRK